MGQMERWLTQLNVTRMGRGENNWIQTFSGIRFFPTDPHVEDIYIEDIAHALSNMCRFTGHCRQFYSVAQHSVLVSKHTGAVGYGMHGLLHDAAEAYLADVAKPIKPLLIGYEQIEERLMNVICDKFGISREMPRGVKIADARMLRTEARDLMGEPPAAWDFPEWCEPYDDQIVAWEPELAKQKFIERFNQLIGE